MRRGEAQEGAQRLSYAPGVTAVTTGAQRLCLTSAELPPGVRSACHLHRGIESAGFVASGLVDFAYIGPDVPHVVGNAGHEPALIVVAHSAASDQDGIELLPQLDRLLNGRR